MNKQEQIEKYLKEPVKAGERVWVRGLGSQNKQSFFKTAEIIEVNEDGSVVIKEYNTPTTVSPEDYKKVTYDIGANPFPKKINDIRTINFPLESVLFQLNITGEKGNERYKEQGILIQDCNFNPYVGDKQYYQRPLVWTTGDKVNLIDSIYQGIDCGKILIRKRSWEELREQIKNGDKELFWNDVVDGKQRLNAIKDFMENKFADSYGNYYKDLSENAQRSLTKHQLFSYAELPENSSDESVKEQFLRLNFCGVPQSKEHIEFVKSIRL